MTRARSASRASTDRAELERVALLATRSLVDHMRARYRELEQLTGAPITLHRALLSIGEEPGLSASELARRLGMKRPAVSQVLRSLSSRGWIERSRDAQDHRSVQINPTSQGRQILKLTTGRAAGMLKRAVHGLPVEDVERIALGVEALLAKLPPGPTAELAPRIRSRKPDAVKRRKHRVAAED